MQWTVGRQVDKKCVWNYGKPVKKVADHSMGYFLERMICIGHGWRRMYCTVQYCGADASHVMLPSAKTGRMSKRPVASDKAADCTRAFLLSAHSKLMGQKSTPWRSDPSHCQRLVPPACVRMHQVLYHTVHLQSLAKCKDGAEIPRARTANGSTRAAKEYIAPPYWCIPTQNALDNLSLFERVLFILLTNSFIEVTSFI